MSRTPKSLSVLTNIETKTLRSSYLTQTERFFCFVGEKARNWGYILRLSFCSKIVFSIHSVQHIY